MQPLLHMSRAQKAMGKRTLSLPGTIEEDKEKKKPSCEACVSLGPAYVFVPFPAFQVLPVS